MFSGKKYPLDEKNRPLRPNFLHGLNIEHIQQSDESVLAIHAGIRQPPLLIPPLRQAAIIKQFLAVFNDKRDDYP